MRIGSTPFWQTARDGGYHQTLNFERGVGLDEITVGFSLSGRCQFRRGAGFDSPCGSGDRTSLRLPEGVCQFKDRNMSAIDQVTKHLPWSYWRQLINVAGEDKSGSRRAKLDESFGQEQVEH